MMRRGPLLVLVLLVLLLVLLVLVLLVLLLLRASTALHVKAAFSEYSRTPRHTMRTLLLNGGYCKYLCNSD